jgi:acyl-CoA dehydrogenase
MTAGFNLGLSPDEVDMRDRLHVVAQDRLRPLASEVERDGLSPELLFDILRDAGAEPAKLLQCGIDNPHTLLTAIEELAYGDAELAWAALARFQLVTLVDSCGNAAQKMAAAQLLSAVDATVTVLLYEDFGRQPSEYQTVVEAGDAANIVNGRKCSVAYPHGADLGLLVAREDEELAAFCFAGPRSGLIAERDDREVGKLAVTAVPSGPVRIDGLSLAAPERLRGGVELHRALGQARLLLAAALVGVARASLEFASAYATQRTTWGTAIAQYQGVAFPLVEQTTELHEVRLLLWDVAAKLSTLDNAEEIERTVARAVNKASSLGLRATRNGVQLVGVRAISRDLPCERWYRAAGVLAAIDFDILHTPFGLN